MMKPTHLGVSISDHVICKVHEGRHQARICLGKSRLHGTAMHVMLAM